MVRTRSSPLVLAIGMTLSVALFERWVLGLPYGAYVVNLFATQSLIGACAHVAGLLVIVSLQLAFFWASFASSRPWRVLYWLGFASITFLEYGYVRATGSVASVMDLTTLVHSVPYWTAMAAAGANWWAAIPVLVFGVALAAAPTQSGRHLRRLVILIVVTVTIHSVYAATGYFEKGASFEREHIVLARYDDESRPRHGNDTGVFSHRHDVRVELHGRAASRAAAQAIWYRSDRVPATHLVLVIDEWFRPTF